MPTKSWTVRCYACVLGTKVEPHHMLLHLKSRDWWRPILTKIHEFLPEIFAKQETILKSKNTKNPSPKRGAFSSHHDESVYLLLVEVNTIMLITIKRWNCFSIIISIVLHSPLQSHTLPLLSSPPLHGMMISNASNSTSARHLFPTRGGVAAFDHTQS